MTISRPIMRYFGGKWKNAAWIINHFPSHKIYVEPFGGAASVLIQKEPIFREVYNDLDGEIVNLFRVLQNREHYAELHHKLKFTPFSRAEYDLHTITSDDPVERARRLLIQSWMSFGSAGDARYKTGFRTNISQIDKDPAREWQNWLEVLPSFVERFRRVTIENIDAIRVIEGHDSDETLFYCDPPYPHETRRGNRYKFEMTTGQHIKLLQVLLATQGYVVLSGYDCEAYNQTLQGWKTFTRFSQSQGNSKRIEKLWLSPRTWEALQAERAEFSLPTQLSFLNAKVIE